MLPDTFRIFVADLPRATAFYRDVLQLPLSADTAADGYQRFVTAKLTILLEASAPDDPETPELVGRFTGLSFRVPSVAEAHAKLTARQVAFHGPPARQEWGGVLAHFDDTEGNTLTLIGDA